MSALFRSPHADDVRDLAANMRAIDQLECAVAHGHSPLEALESSIDHSAWTKVCEVDGDVQCLFGVGAFSLLSDDGTPWFLGRAGVERHARQFVLHSKRYVEEMHADYERLANIVHADNALSIRWLKWLGFQFDEGVCVRGHTFLPFHRERAH